MILSRIFAVYGQVVNSDRSVKNPDLLVNELTWWPTPYDCRVSCNTVAFIQVGMLKFWMMLSNDSNSRFKSSSIASLSRLILKSKICGAFQETLKSTCLPHL